VGFLATDAIVLNARVRDYDDWLNQHYHPVERLGGRAVVYQR
jgi:predicted metal-dependent hydrolase